MKNIFCFKDFVLQNLGKKICLKKCWFLKKLDAMKYWSKKFVIQKKIVQNCTKKVIELKNVGSQKIL